MKITIRLSILYLLILLLTGRPEEPDITVVPAPSWKAEFTIKNQTSQAVPLILKPCHYSHLGDPVSLSAMKNEAALLDEALNRLQTDRGGSWTSPPPARQRG